jgi:predicted Zn-ribbon and HTH transcriptional regulator
MAFKKRIETLRQQQAQAPTAKQIKREINENNEDALIESLKRKIKKLRTKTSN